MSRKTKRVVQEEAQPLIPTRKKLKAHTRGHGIYLRAMKRCPITLCVGPAGAGKTYMACGLAVEMFLAKEVDRIIITRPTVTCGEDNGFLPGTEQEKLEPFVIPMLEALEEFLSPKEVREHREKGIIQVKALAYMRGLTMHRSFVIADEMENASYSQVKMLLTRLGDSTKMVLVGDVTQSDVYPNGKDKPKNPFEQVMENLLDLDDVAQVSLGEADIMRPEIVKQIVLRL